MFFFFNDTATTEIYTLSLHDALPIYDDQVPDCHVQRRARLSAAGATPTFARARSGMPGTRRGGRGPTAQDRKSTRLNSSHANISYAVFCLKKKKHHYTMSTQSRYSVN